MVCWIVFILLLDYKCFCVPCSRIKNIEMSDNHFRYTPFGWIFYEPLFRKTDFFKIYPTCQCVINVKPINLSTNFKFFKFQSNLFWVMLYVIFLKFDIYAIFIKSVRFVKSFTCIKSFTFLKFITSLRYQKSVKFVKSIKIFKYFKSNLSFLIWAFLEPKNVINIKMLICTIFVNSKNCLYSEVL